MSPLFLTRLAEAKDMQHLIHLRNALWPDGLDEHLQSLNDFFNGIPKDMDVIYVAEISQQPVGFIELRLRRYAEGSDNSPVPFVEGWFVSEAHRGQGIGKALMQCGEHWARSAGFTELGSNTEIDNVESIAAHGKLGFQEIERNVSFLKRL